MEIIKSVLFVLKIIMEILKEVNPIKIIQKKVDKEKLKEQAVKNRKAIKRMEMK